MYLSSEESHRDRQKAQGLTVTKPTETTQTTNNNDTRYIHNTIFSIITSSQTQIKTEEEKKEEQKPKQVSTVIRNRHSI
jgi:hypothetical protein